MQFKEVVTLYLMIYKISIMFFFLIEKARETNKQTNQKKHPKKMMQFLAISWKKKIRLTPTKGKFSVNQLAL